MATDTKSPTCTSTSPLSFLNSSIGTYASDLRPALTTTKLCSMRTTSAVMTSPARISERCSDSSNSWAKDSDIQYSLHVPRVPSGTIARREVAALAAVIFGDGAVGVGPRLVDESARPVRCRARGALLG